MVLKGSRDSARSLALYQKATLVWNALEHRRCLLRDQLLVSTRGSELLTSLQQKQLADNH